MVKRPKLGSIIYIDFDPSVGAEFKEDVPQWLSVTTS